MLTLTEEQTNELVQQLTSTIGHYPSAMEHHEFMQGNLSKEAYSYLTEGVEAYQENYPNNLDKYISSHFAPEAFFPTSSEKQRCAKQINDHYEANQAVMATGRYFQSRLVNYLISTVLSSQNLPTSDHSQSISLKELLGNEGYQLFNLAIQEETHSVNYRDAVFNDALEYIPGKKWAKQPCVIIAGPSASGKTTARKTVINNIKNAMPIDQTVGNIGNYMAVIDGENYRDMSQVCNILIQVANLLGYKGIADLYDESKEYLNPIKELMLKTILTCPEVGLAIPETFSDYLKPSFMRSEYCIQNIMERISADDRYQLIFSRVVGQDDQYFANTVKQMGNNRAWKKGDFIQLAELTSADHYMAYLSLNGIEKQCKSKSYNSSGFSMGKSGSKSVETEYCKMQTENGKDIMVLHIVNDLRVIETNSGVPQLISNQVYTDWLDIDEQFRPALEDYQAMNLDSEPQVNIAPVLSNGKYESVIEENQIVYERWYSNNFRSNFFDHVATKNTEVEQETPEPLPTYTNFRAVEQ